METKTESEVLKANPHIGTLMRRGKKVFYTFRNNIYREHRSAQDAVHF